MSRSDLLAMLPHIDRARTAQGFLTIADMLARFGADNAIPDPFSILISDHVQIGRDNVFYPGTLLAATDGGTITIGDGNQFGEGGVTIRATAGQHINIGNHTRLMRAAVILGDSTLGDGSQVLGPIQAVAITLAAGGSWRDADVAGRGAVLKGFGTARQISVPRGMVINGNGGPFSPDMIEPQTNYH
ncbi:hypothetical protein [Thalassospira sp.]|uniref:hypothetical protein n=1 Tax=Thalassospira sp. TaxID=1912094 RepID=UPI0027335E46|nr:hypothetical protein [Thalassospira sp.]MDP2698453.1 hypothetical protein [Thalassospira sp.]